MEPSLFYCLQVQGFCKVIHSWDSRGARERNFVFIWQEYVEAHQELTYPSIISYTSATTCSILILHMSIVKNIDQLCMHRRSSYQNSYNMSNSLWKLWLALPNITSILNQIDGKSMLWICIQKLASVIIGEV